MAVKECRISRADLDKLVAEVHRHFAAAGFSRGAFGSGDGPVFLVPIATSLRGNVRMEAGPDGSLIFRQEVPDGG